MIDADEPGLPLDDPTLTSSREPLDWTEVPLPPGYQQEVLDPYVKRRLMEAHHDRIEEILAERAWILGKAEDDPLYQEKVLALCAEDPAWWIDRFVWTYDDREGVEEPMVLYPFQQEKIVEPYVELRRTRGKTRFTRVGCKSRGVGYTWVAIGALRTHSFLFLDNWSCLVGAVARDDVDDGGQEASHESLFGKIRYVIKRLPPWMRERLLGPRFMRDEFNKRLYLRNPQKPLNLLVGKQLSGMFGRGHRYSEVVADEIAHSAEMLAADTSLKQTTRRFDANSTPLGKGTFHAQMFLGALPGVQRYYIHWSEHPELTVDWYNAERQHMTDEQVAQELDCSFEGSAGGRVLPEVQLGTHFTLHEQRDETSGHLVGAYDPHLPLHVIIDPGRSGTAVTWGQWDEDRANGRVVDFCQSQDVTIDWLVPFITGEIPKRTHRGHPWPHAYTPAEVEIIQRHAIWKPPATVYGDDYGKSRDQVTGLSAYDELAQYGIFVVPIEIKDDRAAIIKTRLFMRYVLFASRLIDQRNGPEETCPTMGEVVTQWRFPRRKPGDFRPNETPVKDQYSHGGDTLKMWAQVLHLPEATEQPVASGRVVRARGSDLVGGRKRWPKNVRRRRR